MQQSFFVFIFLSYALFAYPGKSMELSIGQRQIEFQPSRSDIFIDGAKFIVGCFREAGEAEQQQTGNSFTKCDNYRINGTSQSEFWNFYDLIMTDSNSVILSEQKIEYSPTLGAYACISVHPLLDGIPNKVNSGYYAVHEDRYAMLSYCTVESIPKWGLINPRITHNRVKTLDEFLEGLSTIRIKMTDKPLPRRLGSTPFKRQDLASRELYRCGHLSPMPDGYVPESEDEPIAVPVGVYADWEFSPEKVYQCGH